MPMELHIVQENYDKINEKHKSISIRVLGNKIPSNPPTLRYPQSIYNARANSGI